MSLSHLYKIFHKHLLLDQPFLSFSFSFSFSFPLSLSSSSLLSAFSPSSLYLSSCCTYTHSSHSDSINSLNTNIDPNNISSMSILRMNDHFSLKSGQCLSVSPTLSSASSSSSLSSKLKSKDSSTFSSGLIESLRRKASSSSSSDSTLFSPLSPALSSGPKTAFASSLTRSKCSNKNRPLCSTSCFSPLELPSDIFVYLLEFLTPAELWKLSMASREMYRQVSGFMSRIQRFKYSAVRILYQENTGIMYVSPGGSTNNGSPSPMQTILARIKGTSNPRSRQSYWEAQGLLLVTIIVEGTPFEPAPGSRQVKEASSKSTLSLLESQHINNHASNNNATTHSLQYIASSSTSTLVSSHASASSSQLSLGSTNTTNNNSSNDSQNDDGVKVFGPLPMDRFQAIVDLLFDPNIVYLNHRRAIINCARYVSASVADYFKEALSIKEPLDPLFHSAFLRQYTVRTGPNLAVFLHNSGVDVEGGDESQSSDQPKSSPQAVGLTTITPPNGLQKYFQIMLWHRCISDLIALYNRIQRLHVNNAIPSIKKSEERTIPEPSEPLPESNKAVCCQDLPTIPSPTSPAFASHVMAESYPFCCNAHSLIFTTHYPASIPIPYPIRQKFRRMAQKSKSLWSAVLSGHNTNTTEWDETPLGRYIQYIGSKEKLQFCNGVARPISPTAMAAANAMGSGSTAASSLNSKQLRDMDDEELVQRRYRIEERIRQDTLAKQELLSLCLMACGLFMVAEGRFRHVPPTLMSLLRRYGPWDKGVWREGEWRRSAIDITVDTELEGASKNKKSVSPSPSLNLSAFVEEIAKEENRSERGPWQNLCIAAIQFLAHENLTWGGATGNEELSRLRVTINSTQWIYHE